MHIYYHFQNPFQMFDMYIYRENELCRNKSLQEIRIDLTIDLSMIISKRDRNIKMITHSIQVLPLSLSN